MKIYKILLLFLIFMLTGCKGFSKDIVPYLISSSIEMEESPDYEIAGLNLSFHNRSEKTVKTFTIAFYVFDEDGEPASFCRSNIVISVEKEIGPGESSQMLLPLDQFFSYRPEELYTADYLYVSRIIYSDQSSWTDPFGLALY
ncbi:MAG: hypothetical protein K5681_08535 [Treponema sp.]|nr:hypothetical protein [Treponema sp.]